MNMREQPIFNSYLSHHNDNDNDARLKIVELDTTRTHCIGLIDIFRQIE